MSPRWLRVSLRTVTIPRSGREREGVTSRTSLSTCRMSPGRVGFGQLISPPAPMMPPAIGAPPSTRSRMVIAAVCQPLAARPANSVRLAECIVEVKRLRVELAGEGLDLRFVDRVRSAVESLSDVEIVEKEFRP